MVEPREIHPGVLMARKPLSDDAKIARVRVVNCCSVPCTVLTGELLATAESADSRTGEVEKTFSDFAHMQCLIDKLPDELTEKQREQAGYCIKSYAHIVSRLTTDLGCNHVMPHRMNTRNYKPVKESLRRQPYAYLPEIERNVQEMLVIKIIEPTQSPWSSDVCWVRKKDVTFRFCVEYRKLNNVTVKDSYPFTTTDTDLDSIGGARYFSTLDLRSRHWQTVTLTKLRLSQGQANVNSLHYLWAWPVHQDSSRD